MKQKSYYTLDDKDNVLALLTKGYSFIAVGHRISYRKGLAGADTHEVDYIEGIPHAEHSGDGEYMLLSRFLKNAPLTSFRVESTYF